MPEGSAREVFLAMLSAQADRVSSVSAEVGDSFVLPAAATDDDRRFLAMAGSPDWPVAMAESLIPRTDQQLDARAALIASQYFAEPLGRKKILDFGCGDGRTAAAMRARGADVVGYDLAAGPLWKPGDGLAYLTDWEQVKAAGPFDMVLMMDVYDHSPQASQSCLKVKEVVKPGGRVYFRGHPAVSRHGFHLHRFLNKAYLHLFLSDECLASFPGLERPATICKQPLTQYRDAWRVIAGMRVLSHEFVTRPIERFFLRDQFMPLIISRWYADTAYRGKFPGEQLEVEFVDLVLGA